MKRRQVSQLSHRRWRRLRDQVVKEEPLCRLRLPGCTIVSNTADHIIPVRNRPDLKFERANLRGSCHHCNMRRGHRPLERVRQEMKSREVYGTRTPQALEFFR